MQALFDSTSVEKQGKQSPSGVVKLDVFSLELCEFARTKTCTSARLQLRD
jgi:hypothetical protein